MLCSLCKDQQHISVKHNVLFRVVNLDIPGESFLLQWTLGHYHTSNATVQVKVNHDNNYPIQGVIFGPKLAQIGTKWDKPVLLYQISVNCTEIMY